MTGRARLRVVVGADTIRAEAWRAAKVVWAAEVGYAGASELADRLTEVVTVEGLPRVRRTIDVRLLRPVAQVRELDGLPAVGDAGLAGILAHQPQRFFRKNGTPLVTDGTWLGSVFRRSKPRVALAAAVEEPVVSAIVTAARAAGFSVADIRPDGAPNARLSLLPGVERGQRYRARLRRLAWLGGTAAALWVALALGLILRERRAIEQVDHALSALDAPVQALLAARAQSDDARRMVLAVLAADRNGARTSRLLVELARMLPDSAFLTSVALRSDGSGVVSGAAPRPTDVVVQLERSGVVARPHLEGRGVRESIGGRELERFTVVFGEPAR